MTTTPALELVCESKIRDLMPEDQPGNRWEASGILVKPPHYFVVFDDRPEIARLSDDLQPNSTNGLFGMAKANIGYEGITYNAALHRYYLLVEAHKQTKATYQASIFEYDDQFKFLKHRPLDFDFESSNKGFEAAAHVRRDEKDFLLALCEGNKCKCGSKGKKKTRRRAHSALPKKKDALGALASD